MFKCTLQEVWQQTRRETLLGLWDYIQYGTARDAGLSDYEFGLAYETLQAWVNGRITAQECIIQLDR